MAEAMERATVVILMVVYVLVRLVRILAVDGFDHDLVELLQGPLELEIHQSPDNSHGLPQRERYTKRDKER